MIREVFLLSLSSIRQHRLRSFLTLLGVIIGVATLTSVISITNGIDSYIKEKVFTLSPDVTIFVKFGIIRSREEFLDALHRRNLDLNDYKAVKDNCADCKAVGAGISGEKKVSRGRKYLPTTQLYGCTPNLVEMWRFEIPVGHMFTAADIEQGARVAVIGTTVAEELFPGEDPLGQQVLIGGQPFRIIGVIAKQGSFLGQDQDNQAMLPVTTYRQVFGYTESVDIYVQSPTIETLSRIEDEGRAILRARHLTPPRAPDPFGTLTSEIFRIFWKQLSGGIFVFAAGVASIALVVGGIVIMNIMLVSVTERTREIGVRLALGARRRHIRLQFLIEAAILSAVGGLIGVGAGFALSLVVDHFFTATFSPMLAVAGMSLAIVVGLISGLWPALRASNLTPIEALRFET
jgi:putative ABC transport system permease protein